jgi:phage host-nuclease inhibitor protein Gam
MSQTPITVTYSLEEVLAEINRKLDTLQKDVNDSRLETKVAIQELRTETKVASQELKGEIKSLDEKVNGLGKRLENQEFVNRGILVALVVAIVGGVAKLFGWVGNP